MKPLLTLLDAALFVVATCIIIVPELRVAPMRYAFYALAAVSVVSVVYRLHVTGMLRLTPRAIMNNPARKQFSVLGGAAAIMAAIAMMVVAR